MANREQGKGSSQRGTGAMDSDKKKEISSRGGKASHEKGTGHEFTSGEAKEAGKKGGRSFSGGGRSSR